MAGFEIDGGRPNVRTLLDFAGASSRPWRQERAGAVVTEVLPASRFGELPCWASATDLV